MEVNLKKAWTLIKKIFFLYKRLLYNNEQETSNILIFYEIEKVYFLILISSSVLSFM